MLDRSPGYRVQDNLRERVKFTCHDVTASTAMFASRRFDLVSCRNVLIYLQQAAQRSATRRLLEMIREDGVLCLGEAEWPPHELAERLKPLSHKTRLFRLTSNLQFLADHELNRESFRPRA